MNDAMAKKWLSREPGARPRKIYDREADELVVAAYIPTVGDRDVHLSGTPEEYPTEHAALTAAVQFQSAIRSNHPSIR